MKRFVTYLVTAAALAVYLGVGANGLDFTGIDRDPHVRPVARARRANASR